MSERSPDLDRTDALPGATPSQEQPGPANARTAALAMLGRRLGEFVLVGRLGEGGFGTVYRAEQPALGREAVVKILHARHRERGDWAKRFLREAQLASRLEHPYAAHIYAFGAEADGLLWIAMELVRGMPLDRLLAADGPLPVARLVPLLERICEVVHTAHEQGIVHRDLKPGNVMVIAGAVACRTEDGIEFAVGSRQGLGALDALSGHRRWYRATVTHDLVALRSNVEGMLDVLEDNVDLAVSLLSALARDARSILPSQGPLLLQR